VKRSSSQHFTHKAETAVWAAPSFIKKYDITKSTMLKHGVILFFDLQ